MTFRYWHGRLPTIMRPSIAYARTLIVGLLAALLSVAVQAAPPMVRIDDPEEALALQQVLRKSQAPNLAAVVVARFRMGEEPLEVTSLMPAIVAQAREAPTPALTVFRFSDSRDTLTLFTRDASTGAAYRLDLSRPELESGMTLEFPVVNEDGTVTYQSLQLVKLFEF